MKSFNLNYTNKKTSFGVRTVSICKAYLTGEVEGVSLPRNTALMRLFNFFMRTTDVNNNNENKIPNRAHLTTLKDPSTWYANLYTTTLHFPAFNFTYLTRPSSDNSRQLGKV
ncbi:unnamed protein product [Cercopithifilaria johnstoni]|uniref:Uncharacterized protein n=1 Tax=Cercopithifilaria johnstoni TaxID=2874296 RepID=A0A8J2LWF9_9BILA|nr:unnamed protein product [Cercopithifilaria johnstoni]